jgi:Rps23 Pro-64 3,4-dihydroxylase Tpa1-like proline 4-hydroxylase
MNMDYLLIDNFYTNKELKLIEEEILALKQYGVSAQHTKANLNLKTGSGLFLDTMFLENREASKILTLNRKLFSDEVFKKAIKLNAFFGHLKHCNFDATLLNYYSDGEEYKPHRDQAVLSAVTLFGIGSFTGGEFCFPEINETVAFKHNRLVLFPSCMEHQALSITTKDDSCRVSIAQFLSYR